MSDALMAESASSVSMSDARADRTDAPSMAPRAVSYISAAPARCSLLQLAPTDFASHKNQEAIGQQHGDAKQHGDSVDCTPTGDAAPRETAAPSAPSVPRDRLGVPAPPGSETLSIRVAGSELSLRPPTKA